MNSKNNHISRLICQYIIATVLFFTTVIPSFGQTQSAQFISQPTNQKECFYRDPSDRDVSYRHMFIQLKGTRIIAYEDPLTRKFVECNIPYHEMSDYERSQMKLHDSRGRSYELYYGDCNYTAQIGKLTVYFRYSEEEALGDPEKALWQFIAKNIHYPESAMEDGITGKVIVGFDIEADGSITNIHIIKSVHPLLDKEALRLARKLPKFKPAIKNGVNIKSTFTLPITFKLNYM